MGRTQVDSKQIEDGGVKKEDLNTTETGQSVITDIYPLDNTIEIVQTGADVGTGSVGLKCNLGSNDNPNVTINQFNYWSTHLLLATPKYYLYWIGGQKSLALYCYYSGRYNYYVYWMYGNTKKRTVHDERKRWDYWELIYLSNNGSPVRAYGLPPSANNGHCEFMVGVEDESDNVIRGELLRHGDIVTSLITKVT